MRNSCISRSASDQSKSIVFHESARILITPNFSVGLSNSLSMINVPFSSVSESSISLIRTGTTLNGLAKLDISPLSIVVWDSVQTTAALVRSSENWDAFASLPFLGSDVEKIPVGYFLAY